MGHHILFYDILCPKHFIWVYLSLLTLNSTGKGKWADAGLPKWLKLRVAARMHCKINLCCKIDNLILDGISLIDWILLDTVKQRLDKRLSWWVMIRFEWIGKDKIRYYRWDKIRLDITEKIR